MLGILFASTLLALPSPQEASKQNVTGITVGSASLLMGGVTMMALSHPQAIPGMSSQGRTALFVTGAVTGTAALGAFATGLTYAIGRPSTDSFGRAEQRALRRRGIGLFVVSGLGAATGIACGATTVFGEGCPLGLTVAGGALAVSGALFGSVLMGLSLRPQQASEMEFRGLSLSGRF